MGQTIVKQFGHVTRPAAVTHLTDCYRFTQQADEVLAVMSASLQSLSQMTVTVN